MKRQLIALAALGTLLAACSQPADEPQNAAIDPTPMQDQGTTPGANSFSEDQARGAIENAGYTDVTGLTKGDDGVWKGTAMQAGASTQVSVDYRGSVTPAAGGAAGASATAPAAQ